MPSYPLELFQLNAAFARKVAALTGLPYHAVLLRYTHAYRRFRLGQGLDENHPVWQAYLSGVQSAPDPAEYTYHFYLERERQMGALQISHLFGCFSYEPQPDGSIRLHFGNLDTSGLGPLSRQRMPARLEELTAMFADIRAHVPRAGRVVGGSWLYNLNAYCRLFPLEYSAHPRLGKDDFPYIALWGQFLDHRQQVKPDLVRAFLDKLDRALTLEEAAASFPYPVLYVEAPLELFFNFYGV